MKVLVSDGYKGPLVLNGSPEPGQKTVQKTLFLVSVFWFRLRLMADWLVGVRTQLPVLKDIPPNELTQAAS